MSKAALQKAIDCLTIQDVFQQAAVSKIGEGFDPKYSSDDEFDIEFKHVVKRSEVIQIQNEDDLCIFRVYIDLGVRWVSADKDDEIDNKNTMDIENSAEILAFIESTYVAEYLLRDRPGKNALNEFALNNASYHVWPYWREYIMSQGMRMNLPKIALPAVQFATNKNVLDEKKS